MKTKPRTYTEAYAEVKKAAEQIKRRRGKYYDRWKAGMEAYHARKMVS